MTLQDEINSIQKRTQAELRDAHDYYTYTKVAWQTLERLSLRNELPDIEIRNINTGSKITRAALLSRSRGYIAGELTSSTLQQFVTSFEIFLTDILRYWLLAYPDSLSKSQLTGREILGLPDKDAIVLLLVEKRLREIFYDRPTDWFDYLKQLVNIASPTVEEALKFAEIKATRDVLVHGQGIANAFYKDKAGEARAEIGQRLELDGPYHQASWDLIFKLVGDIGEAMADKAESSL